MARINFDTAKRLDITTRLGDSFELELTLKDSSGIPINLFGSESDGTNTYKFKMLIQRVTPITNTIQTFGGLNHLYPGANTITATLTDDATTTTADTSDASYVASTAATGKVKFSLSAEDMQGGPEQLIPGYMYDIQYVDPATQTPPGGADTEKTILYGSFNFIKDVSITL
jgi:hypothetical protein